MKVNDTATITLKAPGIVSPQVIMSNPDIAEITDTTSSARYVTVQITALKPGMTGITLVSEQNNLSSWPREIWVYSEENKQVPGLTDDIEALMNEINSGDKPSESGGGSGGNEDPDNPNTGGEDKPAYDEDVKDVGIQGLSVYPRFAIPEEVSDDAYLSMYEYTRSMPPYSFGLYTVEDIDIIASRDAIEVFNELKADLINDNIATKQLVAVVLPEIGIQYDGYYMFRLPVENVKNPGTAIFWYKEDSESVQLNSAVPDYSYEKYNFFHDNQYIFMDDHGNSSNVISGDEYISVAVYLEAGTYAPVITAEATENDVKLIKESITPSTPASGSESSTSTRPNPTPSPGTSADVSPDIVPVNSPDISPDIVPVISSDISPDISPDDSGSGNSGNNDNDNNSGGSGSGSTDNEDNNGGGRGNTEENPAVEPESAIPESPAVSIQSIAEAIIDTFRSLSTVLSNLISETTEIEELPESASGVERDISDVSSRDLAVIPETQQPAVVLSIMRVTKPAIYLFGVSLPNLQEGARIYIHMMAEVDGVNSVHSAADEDTTACVFYDDDRKIRRKPLASAMGISRL